MKKKRLAKEVKSEEAKERPARWPWLVAGLLGLFAVFEVYGSALNGAFVLDDRNLPFFTPGFTDSLRSWIGGVRPLLMLSYWLNHQASGENPFSYHVVNIIVHFANATLVVLVVHKLLESANLSARLRYALALFVGGLFLLHPLATESVAYIAGRSESFSAFFALLAWTLFLYVRKDGISWPATLVVAVFCASALLVKENALAIPAVFLITDLLFGGPGLRSVKQNWRLYAIFAGGGMAGGFWVWRVLSRADTAGFAMKDLPWYQYFYTQCRVIWSYIRLFVLPYGQNVDPDFAFSRSLSEHGAIFGLAGLIAVTILAWIIRRRFPYACYGWLIFLALLAPTSSFVPIRDPFAERRVYLPLVGLAIVLLEVLRRQKWGTALGASLAAVLIACGILTQQRAAVWSSPLALWQDSVAKSPDKARPRFQLAFALYEEGRCAEASDEYAQAAKLQSMDFRLAVDWGHALECAGRPDEAIEKLRLASTLERSAHPYAAMGMVYGKQKRWAEALNALAEAENIDPRFEMTYLYRGNVYFETGDRARAAEEYRRVLAINPNNAAARDALARLGL
jgi:Tfp pilus assembly protein PilF